MAAVIEARLCCWAAEWEWLLSWLERRLRSFKRRLETCDGGCVKGNGGGARMLRELRRKGLPRAVPAGAEMCFGTQRWVKLRLCCALR